MTACTCGKPTLQGSELCLRCWVAWWATVVERSRIQRIAAARKRDDA